MKKSGDYVDLLNDSIKGIFMDALRISLKNPSSLCFVIKTIFRQRYAARLRKQWEDEGMHVPPFMIVSVTHRCNLRCKGCYAQAIHRRQDEEMSKEKITDIFEEAKELGISIVMLAGGEPLIRKGILDVTGEFPEIIFPLFTNGLLLNDNVIGNIKAEKNVVPVLSIEGYKQETDNRRGEGVYAFLHNVMRKLKDQGVFFGVSITMTRENFNTVTSEVFVKKLIDSGCKLFFFVEYVPVKEETEHLILEDGQRDSIVKLMNTFRERFSGLFIAFPGDEEAFGGCLAAGRGFVHISSDGNVEPCPFAPYSDISLKNASLKEALKSDFLGSVRQNHQLLSDGKGGCALWGKRELVQSLLNEDQY